MRFRVTVRHGARSQRYHTVAIDASDVREALTRVADELPPEVAAEADLVELRVDTAPEEREYLEAGP